jgi:hypothetical protein
MGVKLGPGGIIFFKKKRTRQDRMECESEQGSSTTCVLLTHCLFVNNMCSFWACICLRTPNKHTQTPTRPHRNHNKKKKKKKNLRIYFIPRVKDFFPLMRKKHLGE